MVMKLQEYVRCWQVPALGGTELLHAQYDKQCFTPHVHESYVFSIIESGAQRFRYRGTEYVAPAGSVVLLNPDEVHTGAKAAEQGWRYRGFYPDQKCLADVLAELALNHQALPRFQPCALNDSQLFTCFSKLHNAAERGVCALQLQCDWRDTLLLLLQRYAQVGELKQPGREPRIVTEAKAFLDASLARPPSLEEIATVVGLSPFHFSRVFRQATGLPPYAWVKQRRLIRARTLLKCNWSPLDVASFLGFSDQSHLNRQFKQAYGFTPGAYRRAYLTTR